MYTSEQIEFSSFVAIYKTTRPTLNIIKYSNKIGNISIKNAVKTFLYNLRLLYDIHLSFIFRN